MATKHYNPDRHCNKEKTHKSDHCKNKDRGHCSDTSIVYGEFIRTFTFSSQLPQLPIVQPGGSLIFPTPTVKPIGVRYIEEEDRIGLLVPRGIYLISWTLNPSVEASVNLLVNGENPVTRATPGNQIIFPYAQSITTGVLDVEYLVKAPLRHNNLISLVNGGTSLFTLNDIPNTKIGDTSIITQIRVQRINKNIS